MRTATRLADNDNGAGIEDSLALCLAAGASLGEDGDEPAGLPTEEIERRIGERLAAGARRLGMGEVDRPVGAGARTRLFERMADAALGPGSRAGAGAEALFLALALDLAGLEEELDRRSKRGAARRGRRRASVQGDPPAG